MRKLNGFIYTCALATMCTSANAQIEIVIDNQVIPTEDIQSIVILPNSNKISITTNRAYTVQATSEPPPPGSVKITSLSATPSTITSGQSTKLKWTTQNADSCTASGTLSQFSGAMAVNSSKTVTISAAKTYSIKLTCQGPSGPVSRSTSVVVKAAAPVTNNCSASPLSGSEETWSKFWGEDFPAPGYRNKTARIARAGYLALEFDTGDIVDDGLLVTVGNTVTSGVRFGAISECPGNFKVPAQCDHVWGIGGGISWSTSGKAGTCQLKPNTKYYFNVTFTDGFDSGSSTCTTSNCIATLQHVNR